MRGSFDWAMLRLAILAAFIVPAALMGQSAGSHNKQNSWLAAVDIAEPVLTLHRNAPQPVALPTAVVEDIQQSAAMASQAQQEAMLALRKELARELVRVRMQRAETAARQSAKS
ncbi:hypothetical protein HPT27_10935 [Permianibacter sp. IMCC34836]|uniref:hypothetical protein n=1 Tax=Permianibacter fluminis TaxID=2738515 RepID=UPI0015517051|nr:hypothetical protein [Permianibacter fluminis]NQD37544.1 hypothetical protein [Permianibacter fluminis]